MAKQKPRIKASSTVKKEARTSRTASVPAPAKRPAQHIEVTPVVKNASAAARLVASNIDFEDLGICGITSASVRCTDDETATAFASQLTAFAKAFPGAQVVEFKAYGQEVSIPLPLYLPNAFDDLLADLEGTDLTSIPVPAAKVELLKTFVQCFTCGTIVRTQLEESGEPAQPNAAALSADAVKAHKALVSAATLIVEVISDKPVHLVRIATDANVAQHLQFMIDGKAAKLKTRSQRALCALALLMPTQPFTCEEFMEKYSSSSGEARKDFDTIMRALKNDLPRMGWQPGKGNRWMYGVKIVSTVPETGLVAYLQSFQEQ